MRRSLVAGSLLVGFVASTHEASAREPEASTATSAGAAETPVKPKPRPKPKPAVPKAEAKPIEAGTPELRPGADEPHAPAANEAPASPPQSAFAAPLVACDPGQGVRYDGPNGFSLWVTRAGSVTIDNPLRPLTPDVTRVLQLVIGDRLATAYGRDLGALRRGASPAVLEGLLGGPIRWEAALGSLPDGFDIVSDSGTPLAQMRFRECGAAPAAKGPPAPVARKDRPSRSSRKTRAADQTGAPPPAATAAPGPAAPSQPTATPQRQFNLPQGAIAE